MACVYIYPLELWEEMHCTLAFGSRQFRDNIELSRTLSELITASQPETQLFLNFCQILFHAGDANTPCHALHRGKVEHNAWCCAMPVCQKYT